MTRVQEITESPLAISAETSETAMERRCEVSPLPPRSGTRPPVISTGGAESGLEFFRCRSFRCSWVGPNPFSRSLRPEVGEFDPREIAHDLMCPVCRSGVVFAPSCCDCGQAAAELGDERCGRCAIRAEKEEHEANMAAADTRRHQEDRRALMGILTGGVGR